MLLKQVLEVFEILDSPQADGEQVTKLLLDAGVHQVESQRIQGPKGYTDFVKAVKIGRAHV